MGVQPFRYEDPIHCAIGFKDDLALRHVQFQWLAPVTATLQDRIGGPEWLQDRLQQRSGLVVRLAVNGGLRLLVG